MKKYSILPLSALLMLMLTMSSCELIGGIFNAGFKIGIFVSVLVAGLVIFLIAKMFGGRK